MNQLTISGTVTHHLPTQSGTSKAGKEWTKGGFVIETDDDKYPQSVALSTFGDKVTIPKIGSSVTAHFNLKSREYNGKWYSDIECWKVEVTGDVVEPGYPYPPKDFVPTADDTDPLLPF